MISYVIYDDGSVSCFAYISRELKLLFSDLTFSQITLAEIFKTYFVYSVKVLSLSYVSLFGPANKLVLIPFLKMTPFQYPCTLYKLYILFLKVMRTVFTGCKNCG